MDAARVKAEREERARRRGRKGSISRDAGGKEKAGSRKRRREGGGGVDSSSDSSLSRSRPTGAGEGLICVEERDACACR
jgi:hypothetical protein